MIPFAATGLISRAQTAMRCPICKSPVDESQAGKPGSYFPFCSERCKLIDLGRWLGGKYQIPVVEKDESDPRGDDEYDH